MLHIGILSQPSNFHCQKWARALQTAGARVSVYSLEQAQIPGLRTVWLQPPVRWRGRYRFPSYRYTAHTLGRALAEDAVDVVNALHLTPYGWWGLQAGYRPLVASALGADVLEYVPGAPRVGYNAARPGGLLQPLARSYYARLVRQVIARADLLTADNRHLQLQMERHLGAQPGSVRLLPWGIADEIRYPDIRLLPTLLEKLNLPQDKRIVLAPRGANAFYNAEVILQAFERLASEGPHSHSLLLLSAGYPVAPHIRQQALKLQDRYPGFRFYEGQLSLAEMGTLWTHTDVALSLPQYDGYSATIAEARSAGAIPLVNDLPAYREELTPDVHARYMSATDGQSLYSLLADTLTQLPRWKARIAEPNLRWADVNADILPGAEQFLDWCRALKKHP